MTAEHEPLVRFEVPGRYHDVGVLVREDYKPLNEVLRDQPTWGWGEILEHAREPAEEWVTGGNLYDLIINPHGVTICRQIDDAHLTVIPHQDFITIVEGYLAALDQWHAERGLSDKRIDLHHRRFNPEGKPHHQQ